MVNKLVDIKQVIEEIRDDWLKILGVEGIGQGKENNEDYILVMISSKTNEINKKIPSKYKGFKIHFIETGLITPLDT